jgi:O-antigen/teichoic acid export membrane protein
MCEPDKSRKRHGLRSIARNASYLAAAQAFTSLLRPLYVLVLAYHFGPELYGIIVYGQSWYLAFLPLTGLGIGLMLCREVGRDRRQGTHFVAQTLSLRISAALAAAVACGVTGWLVEADFAQRRLLLIFSFALFGRSLSMWTDHVFTAYEACRHAFRQRILFRPMEVLAGFTVLYAGGGVVEVAAVHASIWWLYALRGLIVIRRQIVPLRLDGSRRNLVLLLARGLPLGLQNLFVAWLLQGPIVLYRHLGGAHRSLGELALAMQAFILVAIVPNSIGAAALPVLSRSVARQDGKDQSFAQGMLQFSFLVGSAAGLAGMALGPWFVQHFLGETYQLAGHLLGPAMWLLIPFIYGNAASAVLVARGQFVRVTLCSFAGILVLLLSFPSLTSAFGPLGALIAAGAGMVVRMLSLVPLVAEANRSNLISMVLRPAVGVLLAVGVFLCLRSTSVWLSLPISWVVLASASLLLGTSRQLGPVITWRRSFYSRLSRSFGVALCHDQATTHNCVTQSHTSRNLRKVR